MFGKNDEQFLPLEVVHHATDLLRALENQSAYALVINRAVECETFVRECIGSGKSLPAKPTDYMRSSMPQWKSK